MSVGLKHEPAVQNFKQVFRKQKLCNGLCSFMEIARLGIDGVLDGSKVRSSSDSFTRMRSASMEGESLGIGIRTSGVEISCVLLKNT